MWGGGETRRVSAEEETTGSYLTLSSKPMCKYPVMSLWIFGLKNGSSSEIDCGREFCVQSLQSNIKPLNLNNLIYSNKYYRNLCKVCWDCRAAIFLMTIISPSSKWKWRSLHPNCFWYPKLNWDFSTGVIGGSCLDSVCPGYPTSLLFPTPSCLWIFGSNINTETFLFPI